MNLTDQQILTKCYVIAFENGYPDGIRHDITKVDGDWKPDCLEKFLFDHDFAKALFGEEMWHYGWNGGHDHQTWRWGWFEPGTKWRQGSKLITGDEAYIYHLQKLALSKDRIDYLRKWLNARS